MTAINICIILFGIKQLIIIMEEDILNYSPTVKFRGTPCTSIWICPCFNPWKINKTQWEPNFKLPSMQTWLCPIHNGTLETFIWSIMWKIFSFSRFNSDNSYMINRSLYAQVTFVEKPQLKIISFQK